MKTNILYYQQILEGYTELSKPHPDHLISDIYCYSFSCFD